MLVVLRDRDGSSVLVEDVGHPWEAQCFLVTSKSHSRETKKAALARPSRDVVRHTIRVVYLYRYCCVIYPIHRIEHRTHEATQATVCNRDDSQSTTLTLSVL